MAKAAVWLWVWGEEYNSICSTEVVYFNNVSQRGLTKMIASMNPHAVSLMSPAFD